MANAVTVHAVEDNGIVELRFVTGRRLNALTLDVVTDLLEAVHALAGRADCTVLVLRGAPGAFSGGADLKDMGRFDHATYEHYIRTEFALFDAIEQLPCITIAALEGPCLGNSAEMALACDFRIADEGTSFGLAETRVGFQGPATRITRYVGIGVAKDLLYHGRILDAATAKSLGLVTEVVAPGSLDDAVARYAADCAALPGVAIRATKRNVARAYAVSAEQVAAEIAASFECFDTVDFREALDAFFAKRPPRYLGR